MFRPKNSPDYISSKQLRTQILTDPRLAILLCAVSEAFVIQKQVWNCRELSNISWALAKIDFVPNPDTIPLPPSRRQQQQSNSDVDDNIGNSQDNAILMSAKKLRESDLLAGSSKKQKTKSSDEEYAKLHKQWISQMRILGAHLLDGIALHMQHKLLPSFKSQELANMIWSLATVARGDVPRLRRFSPQELNCLGWAYAKLGAQKSQEVDMLFEGIGNEVGKRIRFFSSQVRETMNVNVE